MQKRLISLLCALMMLALCMPLAAAEDAGDALTMTELETWVEGYKARAMATQPLNDPTEPAAFSEDGYAFIYEFATLYMDRPEMTGDSVVRNLVVTSPDEVGPRDTRVDMQSYEILAAYYNENPTLAGDRGFAALYVSNMLPSSAQWAWVQRDGQRIMTIQYAVQEQAATGGDGYTDAGVIYTLQDNLVSAIRAYGLDARISLESVQENVAAVQEVMDVSSYVTVPTSIVGTDLEPFQRDDLLFAGMDFLTLTPESAVDSLGECLQDSWMADDTGEFVRTMEFAGCEISFIYDANKENPVPNMLSINEDGMEGPRYVRIGDTFSSVLTRFRHSEGAYDGVSTEALYGSEGSGAWGTAEYGSDGTSTLRYSFPTEKGEVVLYMYFVNLKLHEVLLYIA
ncbi:MAG: hypothetical protein IJ507_04035 [Clostridia bacterium]|nr:hypothetical protein [Clostridia bacterium]